MTCLGDITILSQPTKLSFEGSRCVERRSRAFAFCQDMMQKGMQFDYYVFHPETTGCVDYSLVADVLGDYSVGKHLLLQERKGEKRKFLVITDSSKNVDLSSLKEEIGCRKLEFVSPDLMESLIHTTPGNVSIFNMRYDSEEQVQVVIDKDLLDAEEIAFHPLYNGMSVFMGPNECFKYLSFIGRDATILPIKGKVLQK